MRARVAAMILLVVGTTAVALAHYGPGAPIFAFWEDEGYCSFEAWADVEQPANQACLTQWPQTFKGYMACNASLGYSWHTHDCRWKRVARIREDGGQTRVVDLSPYQTYDFTISLSNPNENVSIPFEVSKDLSGWGNTHANVNAHSALKVDDEKEPKVTHQHYVHLNHSH